MSLDLLSLGSAVVDKILQIDDSFLEAFSIPKGSTRANLNIPHEELIQKSGQEPLYISGGSAANATKVASGLGLDCGFIAKIGRDPLGQFFKDNLTERRVKPYLGYSEKKTGQVLNLITPDGERSMCPVLDACMDIQAEDIHPEYFKKTRCFLFDGYNFFYEQALGKAIASAREARCLIALDLSSHEIVKTQRERIHFLLSNHIVDILFANEQEIRELTGIRDAVKALHYLSTFIPIVTVMLGDKGAIFKSGDHFIMQPAFKVKSLDSTGAGDHFVGGFMYGYLSELPYEECMRIGSLTASQGVRVFGGELPLNTLKHLKKYVQMTSRLISDTTV